MRTGKNIDLSPQKLISCHETVDWGCDGGYLDETFWYLESDGTVLNSCMPYSSGNKTIG